MDIWNLAVDLSLEIYRITKNFPREEVFGLTSQIRRACISIPSNIAEGSGRSTNNDFKNFLHISLGSLRETECQLTIAEKLNYTNNINLNEIKDKIDILGGKISKFISLISDV